MRQLFTILSVIVQSILEAMEVSFFRPDWRDVRGEGEVGEVREGGAIMKGRAAWA